MFWHKIEGKKHKIDVQNTQNPKILEQKYKKSADLPILWSKTHKKLHVVIITNNYYKFCLKSKFLKITVSYIYMTMLQL